MGPRAHVRRIRTSRPGTSMMSGADTNARGSVYVSRTRRNGSPGPPDPHSAMTNSATLNHVQTDPILYSFPNSDLLSAALADFVIKVCE